MRTRPELKEGLYSNSLFISASVFHVQKQKWRYWEKFKLTLASWPPFGEQLYRHFND